MFRLARNKSAVSICRFAIWTHSHHAGIKPQISTDIIFFHKDYQVVMKGIDALHFPF